MANIKFTREQVADSNRKAWNQATVVHRKWNWESLVETFSQPGASILDPTLTHWVEQHPVLGKSIAHLSCNNGIELISLINHGAGSGVGFDISDEAIKDAEKLRDLTGANCKFVRIDNYDIDSEYHTRFDLVLLTVGALCWLPDLNAFFEIASDMLKPEGQLLIYEMHPFTNMLAQAGDDDFKDPLLLTYPYFQPEPLAKDDGIDYFGKTQYKSETSVEFFHTMSDIINALVRTGIGLVGFQEFPHDISNLFAEAAPLKKAPLCYLLHGKKCG